MLKDTRKRLKSIRTREDIMLLVKDIAELVTRIFSSLEITSWWKNAALSVPRIIIGCLILSEEWRLKLGIPLNKVQEYLPIDILNQTWFGWKSVDLLSWFDTIGFITLGGMMITGFNTRLSALSILWTASERLLHSEITHSVSIIWMILLVLVAGYSLILGSGKFGLDYWIAKKMKKKRKIFDKKR